MIIDPNKLSEPPKLPDFDNIVKELSEILEEADKIYGMQCKAGCLSCCREPIGLSSIEFSMMRRTALPVNKGFGCPFLSVSGCTVYEFRPFVCRAYGPKISGGKVGGISLNREMYPKVWEKYKKNFEKYGGINPISQGSCSIVEAQIKSEDIQRSMDLWKKYGEFIIKHNFYVFRIGTPNNMIMHDFEEELGVELAQNWNTPFVSLYFPDGEFRPKENK